MTEEKPKGGSNGRWGWDGGRREEGRWGRNGGRQGKEGSGEKRLNNQCLIKTYCENST